MKGKTRATIRDKIPVPQRAPVRKSSMDMEWWKSFFEFGGVILLFLTFAFGAGFMLTGKKVNERQSERLRTFDSDLTTAKTDLEAQKERAAKAEGQLAGLQKSAADAKSAQQSVEIELEKQRAQNMDAQARLDIEREHLLVLERETGWRRINVLEVAKDLKGFAGTQFMVRYVNNPECFRLMDLISMALQDAGWKPTLQEKIPVDNSGFSDAVEINFARISGLQAKTSESTVDAGQTLWKVLGKQEGIGPAISGVTDINHPEFGTIAPAIGPGTPVGLNVVVISIGWQRESFGDVPTKLR